jgi:hypothetical protein
MTTTTTTMHAMLLLLLHLDLQETLDNIRPSLASDIQKYLY